MRTEAEIEVMCLPVKECQGLLAITKLEERQGRDSLSEPSDGANPANTLILDVQLTKL